MQAISAGDKKRVVVGRPLPFSIYSAERKLLLAAGRIVPNEFVRENLLRSGAFSGGENAGESSDEGDGDAVTDDLEQLQADYQHTATRQPIGFQMELRGTTYHTRVIGVSENAATLIMSSPLTAEGALAALHEGENWTFKALYSTAAVRFRATVTTVATHPFAYFCIGPLADIDRRSVRQWPRTMTSLPTARRGEPQRIIVDLGVGGARVAVKHNMPIQRGQSLLLNPTLQLAVGIKILCIDATVLNVYGSSDSKHPRIDFYGVKFEKLPDLDRLILHAYVQEHLNTELDRVWNVLGIAGI